MRFTLYEKDIVGKAKNSIVPSMEWQDIAQELRITLWQKLDKFQGKNGAKERTFAIAVMRNRVLDLNKAAHCKKRLVDSYHFSLEELIETEFQEAL